VAELGEALRQNHAYKLLECFTWTEGEFRLDPWIPDVADAPLIRTARVVFAGISKVGSTIRDWSDGTALNAQLRAALAQRPSVVLCSLGTNDEALTPDSARAELPLLDALIALVKSSGAELGWIGPPKLQKTNGMSQIIQAKLPQNRYFHSETFDIPRAGDGLHPTIKGYTGWAGQIWLWVRG